jgi:subtilisin family serine protease
VTRKATAALVFGVVLGVLSIAEPATAGAGHSRLTPLPTVLPPPTPETSMRWTRLGPAARTRTARAYARGSAVVGLARGVDARRFARILGLRVVTRLPRLRAIEVAAAPRALAALAARPDPRVRYVEPVARLRSAHTRDDPLTWQLDRRTRRPYEWAFQHVGVDRALTLARGDPRILVGVVDSGVTQVPDLKGKIAETFWDPAAGRSGIDVIGHGTFVSSLIAARNDDGFGLAGFCGACRVAVFKAIPLTDVQIALGIQKLTDAHVRVLNLSIVTRTSSQAIVDALNYAASAGVLVIAASGNEGSGTIDFPASYLQPGDGAITGALAVGAVDAQNRRASFSNWGSQLSLVAPGAFDARCNVGIIGALPASARDFEAEQSCAASLSDEEGNRYAYASGTSFAAPQVAGIAALVWSVRPELTAYQVASLLQQTAARPPDTGWNASLGWGVVNAKAAVEQLVGTPATDELSLTGLGLQGRREPGQVVTARVRATWGDGLPVVVGAAFHCRTLVGGKRIRSTPALLDGVVSCAFTLPGSSAGARVDGTIWLTAPAVTARAVSFSFSVRRPPPASRRRRRRRRRSFPP